MFKFLIKLFVIITFIILVQCNFFKKEAKVGLSISYIRECKADIPAIFNLTFNKFNRTHYAYACNISASEPFDATYYLDVEVRKWGDGGWKKNFYHFYNKDACSNLFLYLGPFWRDMLIAANAPPKCPIQPGFYSFKDLTFDLNNIPIVIQPGKFYFKFLTIKNRKITSCTDGEIVLSEEYDWK